MAGWLAYWLAGLLADWLIGWLAYWLASLLAGWRVDYLVNPLHISFGKVFVALLKIKSFIAG